MRYVGYTAVALLLVVVVFVLWRVSSVGRGARRRNERILRLLDPLGRRLEQKLPLDPAEVRALAAAPGTRGMLYQALEQFGRLDDFPQEFKTRQAHAEALLVYWMMHPNELQDPPATIELVEAVNRRLNQREAEFLVFRYRMPEGHWAGNEWILGLSGPFFPGDQPYSDSSAGSFSVATDRAATTTPSAVVDRYVQLVGRRFGWEGA